MNRISVKHLSSFSQSTIGLLTAKSATPVYLQTRFGIHTFGMRFDIDVLILNDQNEIVRIRKKLGPNAIFFWSPMYNNVIELPAGYVDKNNLSIGEKVQLDIVK